MILKLWKPLLCEDYQLSERLIICVIPNNRLKCIFAVWCFSEPQFSHNHNGHGQTEMPWEPPSTMVKAEVRNSIFTTGTSLLIQS